MDETRPNAKISVNHMMSFGKLNGTTKNCCCLCPNLFSDEIKRKIFVLRRYFYFSQSLMDALWCPAREYWYTKVALTSTTEPWRLAGICHFPLTDLLDEALECVMPEFWVAHPMALCPLMTNSPTCLPSFSTAIRYPKWKTYWRDL